MPARASYSGILSLFQKILCLWFSTLGAGLKRSDAGGSAMEEGIEKVVKIAS